MGALRILLAIGICFSHATGLEAPDHWMMARTAVFVFFVISGFYMQMVLSTRYTPGRLGDVWLKRFYLARYLRLFPAYAAACAAMLGYAALVHILDGRVVPPFDNWNRLVPIEDIKQLIYGIGVLVSNVTMFGLNVPSSKDLLVVPSWSMGLELSFYLIAPFILRKSDRFLLSLLFAGLLFRLIPYNGHAPIFGNIEYFIMGAFSYRKRHLLEIGVEYPRWLRQGIPFVGMLLLMAISLPTWDPLSIPMTHNEMNMVIYPTLFALIIPSLFNASKNSKFDQVIGEVSYPFYTFHLVVIFALAAVPWSSKVGYAVVANIATLLIAFVVWRIENKWIEPLRGSLATPPSRKGLNDAKNPAVVTNIPVPVENRQTASV